MRKIMTTETPWPALHIEIAASQPDGMTSKKVVDAANLCNDRSTIQQSED